MIRPIGVLPVLVLVSLALSACVDRCSSLKLWQGGEHDLALSTVQSLRYHICKQDWASAARSIAPGSDYARERTGNPALRSYWVVRSPITGIGELYFPLAPEDGIVGQTVNGSQAEVELRHERSYDKGDRPRALELRLVGSEWLIVGYNNW